MKKLNCLIDDQKINHQKFGTAHAPIFIKERAWLFFHEKKSPLYLMESNFWKVFRESKSGFNGDSEMTNRFCFALNSTLSHFRKNILNIIFLSFRKHFIKML